MLEVCPLCGGSNCKKSGDPASDLIRYDCERFNRTVRLDSSICEIPSETEQRKALNLVFEHVMRNAYHGKNTYWCFFDEPSYRITSTDRPNEINVAEIPYPQTLSQKIDRILLNLYAINSDYGFKYTAKSDLSRAFFAETRYEDEHLGIAGLMVELGYLSSIYSGGCYCISANGWKRIEELLREKVAIKQGFMAMAFKNETVEIREAFRKAIMECGYKALAIDEKEHNNQIVPEIFYEIDNSRFLVMDVTYPNYGAYYEAGYALGKGKQVIICCRKDEFNGEQRPHFDIQQKSTIVWESPEDLVARLKKRIEATVK